MESARSTQLAMVTDSAGGNMATSRAKCMAPAAISLELEMMAVAMGVMALSSLLPLFSRLTRS